MIRFKVYVIDPPWNESGGGKSKRGADRHYKLIKKKEKVLEVLQASGAFDNPADHSHCYIWVTNNHLKDGLWLMDALGYTYLTNIAWVKIFPDDGWTSKRWGQFLWTVLSKGMANGLMRWVLKKAGLGQYFRGQHELLLFGRRGKGMDPSVFNKDIELWDRKYAGTVVFAPVGEHSEKPAEAYELMEARSNGPYIDMFARSAREGWSVWGDQAPEEDEEEPT